jgi:hypothetical protein
VGAVAVSVAQPTLTLAGHIEQRFSSLPWDDATKLDANPLGADGLFQSVIASRDYNPDRKQLSDSQTLELQEIVKSYSVRKGGLLIAEGGVAKAAFIRAARSGQVESIVEVPLLSFDPVVVNRVQKDRQKKLDDVKERLSIRLGREMDDWACAVMTTQDPDGVYRTNVIYITRVGEPQVFQARGELKAMDEHMRADYREFFQRL